MLACTRYMLTVEEKNTPGPGYPMACFIEVS